MKLDSGELEPRLAHVAAGLRGLAVDPSAASRLRVMSAVRAATVPRAAEQSRAARAWTNGSLRLGGIAFAMCLATVATGAGAMAASAEALPGSPTHGLRLAGEELSLAFAPASQRARLHERFVRDRLVQAADARRRGENSVAADLLSESRRYLEDLNQEIGELPATARPAVEGELNQLEAETQDPATQGPTTTSPHPDSTTPAVKGQSGDRDGAAGPGGPAGQVPGDAGGQSSPAGNSGGDAISPPATQHDGGP